MIRIEQTLDLTAVKNFKEKLLQWSQRFKEVVFLDGNDISDPYSSFDYALAVEAESLIEWNSSDALRMLSEFRSDKQDWIFGYLSYDATSEKQIAHSDKGLGFAKLFFFQPRKLFIVKGRKLQMLYLEHKESELWSDFEEVCGIELVRCRQKPKVQVQERVDKNTYTEDVKTVLKKIGEGVLKEMNYCMEFFAEECILNPLDIYNQLNAISTPPFACFLKNDAQYALGASPERYMKRTGDKIVTQPIKGTAKRHHEEKKDREVINFLKNDPKERQENILTVEEVKKELKEVVIPESLVVEELCGVYSFQQVHQMISTVVGKVREGCNEREIFTHTFPMCSMVGAPKKEALQLIDTLEKSGRGLYSGAIGYFKPNGDFDFNVVIRTILYHAARKQLSFTVGSGITSMSVPENEYQECLLKAKALKEVLGCEISG